ncbi:MAG: DHH family phosphoesterase [Pseudomonadota bacterium]
MDQDRPAHHLHNRDFDVFNGDADGICALHQLRLAEPRDATLVTGVKRNIQLLSLLLPAPLSAPLPAPLSAPLSTALPPTSEHAPTSGDRVCVLDVSLDSNLQALKALLEQGASVTYFDHHSAEFSFSHPLLSLHWDESPEVCTSILVDKFLQGRFRLWAVTAAYGDNLVNVADRMARQAGLSGAASAQLSELGNLLNYNAYGESVADLHVPPASLYQDLHQYLDPFDFIAGSGNFSLLKQAYQQDMGLLEDLQPRWEQENGAIYVLPNQAWARRISGLLANKLKIACCDKSIAVLTEKADGCFVVSVRSAAPMQKTAHGFCSSFATGGGRQAAGGINSLQTCDVEDFAARFFSYF